ncbi:MAG: lytic transglycosylase domain-containing protein [Bdellovibrionota bacterium]
MKSRYAEHVFIRILPAFRLLARRLQLIRHMYFVRYENRVFAWSTLFLIGFASYSSGQSRWQEEQNSYRLGSFIENRKARFPGAETDSHLLAKILVRESRRAQLDPLLLLSIIETESKYRSNAVGAHGEKGLMQVKPTTARWILKSPARSEVLDLFDPATNISAGIAYLSWLQIRFGSDLDRSIAAYNAGATRTRLLARKGHKSFYSVLVQSRYRDLKREWTQVPHLPASNDQTPRLAFLR